MKLMMILGVCLMALGCGSGVGNEGDVVGGACNGDADCAGGSRCLTGGDFPGGTCSVICESDADCPSATACIDKMGGVCLILCSFDDDCRRGYECEDESRRGAAGSATVCID